MASTLFPVFDVPDLTTLTQSDNRRYKQSVYFDFTEGDFKLDGAYRMTVADGKEAYLQWCRKVVLTERDSFLAYSTDIGTEMEAAMKEDTKAAVESAVEKTITEALMVNRNTEYVSEFEFEWKPDELYVTFTLKGKDSAETQISFSSSI